MSDLNEYLVSSKPKEDITSMENVDVLSLEGQEIHRFAQDTRHRRTLVRWMMCVVSIWLAVVLFIAIGNNTLYFGISDSVLITLLATTTLNVLGLSRIVLNGLFGAQRRKSKNNSCNTHK